MLRSAMALLSLPVAEMNSFDLPRVCLVTGAPAAEFKKMKFSWYPRWVAALIFVPYGGLLLALVISLILRKHAAGELPFSEEGWARHRRSKWIAASALLWMIGGFIGAIGLGIAEQGALAALTVLVALGLIIASMVYAQRTGISVQRIADDQIQLKIPSEAAALAVEAHLHSGVLPAAAV
jgi:hypothetical protein